ncbi:hypothetical protein GOBAR_DD27120 [Gossypium barbadense]|nr:hypothetical protein GOBAR_DD27120 [Gossypium barbadense]
MYRIDVAHCYLEGNAEAVEFCLHNGYQQVLAASTYTLQEGEQPIRAGSISLFDVNAEKGNLELFHRMDTAGIFYIKWSTVGSNVSPLLAQADADGYLRIYSLEADAQVYLDLLPIIKVIFSDCRETSASQPRIEQKLLLELDCQSNGTCFEIHLMVPGGVENKRNVYIAKSSPPNVSKAYFEQFRDDFSRVLRFRSEEMITGGRILLLTLL